LALGADGVNCGTRFMATAEAPIRDEIKQALVAADERDTALVMRSVRNTERVYKNDVVRQVVEIEAKHPGDFSKIAHLMKGDNYRRSFHETGNTQVSDATHTPYS
jgi:nitronate monooxygenase